MAVPDGTCWSLDDVPSADRFVTHARLPLVRWRVPLPAPMPETWVAVLVGTAFLVYLTAFVAATAAEHPAPLAGVEALVAAWLVGKCCVPLAHVRLRREAFAVLRVLRERPGPEGAGS